MENKAREPPLNMRSQEEMNFKYLKKTKQNEDSNFKKRNRSTCWDTDGSSRPAN